MLCDVLHDTGVQSFEQRHPSCETLLEINFSAHGLFGDALHFFAHSRTFGQFVDAFGLYQGRIHIKTDQSAHTSVGIVVLERTIHFQIGTELQEIGLHGREVGRCAAQ